MLTQTVREKLIEINKQFSDGSIRYDGILTFIDSHSLTFIETAVIVAKQHPFIDCNKRTAIKFMEWAYNEAVPGFVYEILKEA